MIVEKRNAILFDNRTDINAIMKKIDLSDARLTITTAAKILFDP